MLKEGPSTRAAGGPAAATDAALTTGQFDLLILDVGLPKLSGFEILKRLRGRHSKLPVLILTALDGVEDRVRGLDLGADDYLAKPFKLAELEARVRALTRRGNAASSTVLKHGDLSFDQVGKTAELVEQDFIQTVYPHPTISETMHESVLAAYGKALHI